MKTKSSNFTSRQLVFTELFVGTLIYAVVLGFFNDYTSIVDAKSFSTIFFAAIVLEVLTYLVFQLKGILVNALGNRSGAHNRLLLFFSVWLVMFLSKFVFIWALDLFFGEYIEINGFIGIVLIIISDTLIHRLAIKLFQKLGQSDS